LLRFVVTIQYQLSAVARGRYLSGRGKRWFGEEIIVAVMR